MKHAAVLLLLITALLIAVPLAGPALGETTSEDLAKETQEAFEAFKAYMIDKKNAAVAQGKELLEKTDAEIGKLQADADEASGEVKAAYEKQIENLEEKRAVAAKKLGELGGASADSWDAAKDGFTEAYKALYDAYKETIAKFNEP